MKSRINTFSIFLATIEFAFVCAANAQPTLDDLVQEMEDGPRPYNLNSWEADFLQNQEPTYRVAKPQFLVAEDGLKLAYRQWLPDAWAGDGYVYLIVPGSTSHSKHFGFLGTSLSERGVLTRVIDFRGTGLSVCEDADACGDPAAYRGRVAIDDGMYFPGRIGDCADADQIVRDLNRHLIDLRTKWPQARILLSGHSSGGGLICRFVEYIGRDSQKKLLDLVDGIVLMAPFVHWNYPANTPTNDLYSVVHMPTVQASIRGEKHRYVLGFNIAGRRASDPWVVGKWTQEMTSAMAAYSPASFWRYCTVPTAYAIGGREELFDIDKARAEHAKATVPGPFVVIDDASHLGIRWHQELVDFMTRFAANPSR